MRCQIGGIRYPGKLLERSFEGEHLAGPNSSKLCLQKKCKTDERGDSPLHSHTTPSLLIFYLNV